jgi:hypothetical protein
MRNLVVGTSEALLDREDHVVADLLCVRCGENLRGRLVTESCTRCGHPISDSVHGDYLIYSDPLAVRRLCDASRLVLYGSALVIGLTVVGLLGTLLASRDVPQVIGNAFDVMRFGVSIAPLIAVVGLVLLTPRRTLEFYKARLLKTRYLIVFGLILFAVLTSAIAGYVYAPQVVATLGLVLWILIPVAAFLRGVEGLMLRVPNYSIARLAHSEYALFVVISLLSLAVLLLREYAFERGWEDMLLGLTVLICISGAFVGARGYLLLTRVRDALDHAAR